jgi:hypothetical protein
MFSNLKVLVLIILQLWHGQLKSAQLIWHFYKINILHTIGILIPPIILIQQIILIIVTQITLLTILIQIIVVTTIQQIILIIVTQITLLTILIQIIVVTTIQQIILIHPHLQIIQTAHLIALILMIKLLLPYQNGYLV